MNVKTKIYIGCLLTLAMIIGGVFLFQSKNELSSQNTSSEKILTPVIEITHAHGLAVDVIDPNKVYIATHHGLLLLKNEKDLYQLGNSNDDYMGFSLHPTDRDVFYSSGHPAMGGNIGFQKSEDGGFSWKKVSDGANGPVDFHAMTVSPANPLLIYGWYQGYLQKSTDEGVTWNVVAATQFPVISLAADTKDENIVYAASPQGLFVSKNGGKDWERLLEGFVSLVSIDSRNNKNLYSYSEKFKLADSSDGGVTWNKTSADFNGETPLHLSYYQKEGRDILYLITEKNSIYKSLDGGTSWHEIYEKK